MTGDNVASMVFCDVNSDGHSELVVGSDDFDIRTFKDEDIIAGKPVLALTLTARYGGTIPIVEHAHRHRAQRSPPLQVCKDLWDARLLSSPQLGCRSSCKAMQSGCTYWCCQAVQCRVA